MFCTNCGEEMRDTDKFCAECGTPAMPRAAKRRASPSAEAASTVPDLSHQIRSSQSTAEVFHAPLNTAAATTSGVSQSETRSVVPISQPESPRVGSASPHQQPSTILEQPATEEAERSLLQAEEIASVRDVMPPEALIDDFPAVSPERPPGTMETRTCRGCGRVNPERNRFCESCGQPMQAGESHAAISASSGWLYDTEPAAPATVATIAANSPWAAAATQTAPAADDSFSYYYDDRAGQAGNRRLLIILLVVLALGIIGLLYLMLRSPGKAASTENISITVSPVEAQVASGAAHDFAATVSGTGNTDVTWSIQEGDSGGRVVNRGAEARGGTVSTIGVYIAPATAGTYHVIATSKADRSKAASAEVTVTPR